MVAIAIRPRLSDATATAVFAAMTSALIYNHLLKTKRAIPKYCPKKLYITRPKTRSMKCILYFYE